MDIIERIAELPEPSGRLSNLQTAVGAALAKSMRAGTPSDFPLAAALRLARESFLASEQCARTAEATFNTRTGQDLLLTNLHLMVFIHLGFPAVSPREPFFACVARFPRSIQSVLLDEYHHLLAATTNWRLNRYTRRPFREALAGTDARYREQFEAAHQELAKWLSSPLVNLTGNTARGIIDRLRKLSAVIQLSFQEPADASRLPEPAEDPSQGRLFLLSLSSASRSNPLGCFARTSDGYFLWSADVLAEFCSASHRAISAPFNAGKEIDSLLENYFTHADLLMPELSADGRPSTAERLRYTDLTGFGAPFPIAADPECRYVWSTGRAHSTSEGARLQEPGVAFWGNVAYDGRQVLEVNETRREVQLNVEHAVRLVYPHCTNCEVSAASSERPLPYAVYEKWALEDALRSTNACLHAVTGAVATRDAFLQTDWTAYSLLHVSTHGEAFEGTPECSWLRLAGSDRVFFSDLMQIDWTSMDLVFLNACMTDKGRRNCGEGSASLAWAFLAGGARAVIATRWPVPDDTAFLFARRFYETLISASHAAMEDVFGQAMQDFRREIQPRPHAWGAYALLT